DARPNPCQQESGLTAAFRSHGAGYLWMTINIARGRLTSNVSRPRIRHAMRHVPRGDELAGEFHVAGLVVEEDVGAEGLEEFGLLQAAEKDRLIDANAPGAQRADDALVCGRGARGDECGAYRRGVHRILGLDAMQGGEEVLERAAGERQARGLAFAGGERFQALLLVDALGLVGKDHRVAVEGNAQLLVAV